MIYSTGMECPNPTCGRSFRPKVAWQIHCSLRCSDQVRHRRHHGRIGPRRPSRRYFRMFLSLLEAADHIRQMKPVK